MYQSQWFGDVAISLFRGRQRISCFSFCCYCFHGFEGRRGVKRHYYIILSWFNLPPPSYTLLHKSLGSSLGTVKIFHTSSSVQTCLPVLFMTTLKLLHSVGLSIPSLTLYHSPGNTLVIQVIFPLRLFFTSIFPHLSLYGLTCYTTKNNYSYMWL